jgi:hypothetical protein
MRMIFAVTLVVALICASASAQIDPDIVNLSLPDITWAVQLRMLEWKVTFQDFKEEFQGRTLQAHDSVSGLQVSVFIDKEQKKYDAVGLRDHIVGELLRIFPGAYTNVDTFMVGPIAYADYISVGDPHFPQDNLKHRYAFYIRDQKWVTIHLEQRFQTDIGDSAFEDFFATIKTLEDYRQTAMDYFVYGSWAYNHRNLKDAAKYYQAALDLEKTERVLPEYLWLVVVDNMAMSYGIPGDNKRAREILEYGISVRPDYPMFYYNKACSFAEEKNLDSALHYLARANDLRANMIPGETMPNPLEDESFKRYKKDKRFKALLEFWGRDPQ